MDNERRYYFFLLISVILFTGIINHNLPVQSSPVYDSSKCVAPGVCENEVIVSDQFDILERRKREDVIPEGLSPTESESSSSSTQDDTDSLKQPPSEGKTEPQNGSNLDSASTKMPMEASSESHEEPSEKVSGKITGNGATENIPTDGMTESTSKQESIGESENLTSLSNEVSPEASLETSSFASEEVSPSESSTVSSNPLEESSTGHKSELDVTSHSVSDGEGTSSERPAGESTDSADKVTDVVSETAPPENKGPEGSTNEQFNEEAVGSASMEASSEATSGSPIEAPVDSVSESSSPSSSEAPLDSVSETSSSSPGEAPLDSVSESSSPSFNQASPSVDSTSEATSNTEASTALNNETPIALTNSDSIASTEASNTSFSEATSEDLAVFNGETQTDSNSEAPVDSVTNESLKEPTGDGSTSSVPPESSSNASIDESEHSTVQSPVTSDSEKETSTLAAESSDALKPLNGQKTQDFTTEKPHIMEPENSTPEVAQLPEEKIDSEQSTNSTLSMEAGQATPEASSTEKQSELTTTTESQVLPLEGTTTTNEPIIDSSSTASLLETSEESTTVSDLETSTTEHNHPANNSSSVGNSSEPNVSEPTSNIQTVNAKEEELSSVSSSSNTSLLNEKIDSGMNLTKANEFTSHQDNNTNVLGFANSTTTSFFNSTNSTGLNSSNKQNESETDSLFDDEAFDDDFKVSDNETSGAMQDYETRMLMTGTSPGCVTEDREKFKRSLTAAVYSRTDGKPTMLSFHENDYCIGTLSKSGRYTLRSRGILIPQFPLSLHVEAGMFMHNRIYLFDSSPDQRVWSFKFDSSKSIYNLKSHSVISTDAFLQVCGIKNYPVDNFRVKAIAQFSLKDPTCIIYDQYGSSYLSQNPSKEAISLVMAIQYVIDTQYIVGIQSIFSWLDEPSATSVYLYGSNGELYELFRNQSDALWPVGNFRLVPYDALPIPNHVD